MGRRGRWFAVDNNKTTDQTLIKTTTSLGIYVGFYIPLNISTGPKTIVPIRYLQLVSTWFADEPASLVK